MHPLTAQLMRRARTYLSGHQLGLCLYLLSLSIDYAVSLIPPLALARCLDAMTHAGIYQVRNNAFLFFGITIGTSVISSGVGLVASRAQSTVGWDAKGLLFRHTLALKTASYQHMEQGQLVARIESDCGAVVGLLIQQLGLVPNAIRGIIILIIAVRLSPSLTLIQLSTVSVAFLVLDRFSPLLDAGGRTMRALYDRYSNFLSETILNLTEIKVVGLRKQRENEFHDFGSEMVEQSLKISRVDRHYSLTGLAINTLLTSVLIVAGARSIATGRMTIGVFVAFCSYGAQLTSCLQGFINYRKQLHLSTGSLERVFRLVDLPQEDYSSSNRYTRRAGIRFSRVAFRYEPEVPVLEDVSFAARPNQVTAVVGTSGCGKSTLLALAVGLYAPSAGQIFVGDTDIARLDPELVRTEVALVSQNPTFFSGSVRENFLWANPAASEDSIIEACERAGIYEYLASQAQGLDTLLTHGGSNLSSGQRHRLALARALIRDSPIILCDETTSSLDARGEELVGRALTVLAETRTVVVVSHRPSTILYADHVIVLRGGRVEDEGDHRSLMQSCSFYRALFENGQKANL